MATNCTSILRSLAWCQGTPELPGIKRRIYYIGKDQIVKWPTLAHDNRGRLTAAAYVGNFVLAADANWKYIDILPDKSQLTSEAQGEYPSMTQLNKLTAVHPGVGVDASALAAYVNNNDCVYLVETQVPRSRQRGLARQINRGARPRARPDGNHQHHALGGGHRRVSCSLLLRQD